MAIIKLNQKNRIVEFPNRYKLNAVQGQSNTYDLENVTGEVTEVGTPFNKIYGDTIDNNFEEIQDAITNKLTPINKYNGLIGNYDSVNGISNYNTSLDINNFDNNQRLLVTAEDDSALPPPNSLVKNYSPIYASDNYYAVAKVLIGKDGNSVSLNFGEASGYRKGRLRLYNTKSGSLIKEVNLDTSNMYIASAAIVDGIVLNNGNYVFAGKGYNDDMIVILANSDLSTIKTNNSYSITASSGYIKIYELNNGNIMVSSCYGGRGYVTIFDNSLNVVKERTQITTTNLLYKCDIIKLSNGNILYIGSYSSDTSEDTSVYILVIDQNGNVVKSGTLLTNISTRYRIAAEPLSNGGAVFLYTKNSKDTLCILDSDFNVINNIVLDTYTTLAFDQYGRNYIAVLENDLIITSGIYNSTYTHINFYYPNGTKLKNYESIATYNFKLPLYKVSDKAVIGYGIVSSNVVWIIFDSNGNRIGYSSTSVESGMYNNTFSTALSKEYLFYSSSSSSNSSRISYDITYSVNAIKINGIDLDTLLEKGKYYELLYNQNNNRFLAEEVRNAN